MTKKIYFDLDGTVYNLYGQKDWLKRLDNEDETVFKTGDFIGDYDEFMTIIHKLFEKGVEFGVITWLPMYATPSFERKCAEVKKDWIYKYLPFVNEIHIIPYGIPKQQAILKKTDLMVLQFLFLNRNRSFSFYERSIFYGFHSVHLERP